MAGYGIGLNAESQTDTRCVKSVCLKVESYTVTECVACVLKAEL